jgi:hypothetical protein
MDCCYLCGVTCYCFRYAYCWDCGEQFESRQGVGDRGLMSTLDVRSWGFDRRGMILRSLSWIYYFYSWHQIYPEVSHVCLAVVDLKLGHRIQQDFPTYKLKQTN